MQSPHVSIAPSSLHPATSVRATDALHCLIVAANQSRRENFGFAAREGGWDVTVCCDTATAVAQARQRLLQMALVDLVGLATDDAASFRFLIEQLACTSRMLLLVCGNLDDAREEVWARHMGVWMYLPGAIDGTELVGLCVAARETVERLSAANRRHAASGEAKKFRASS